MDRRFRLTSPADFKRVRRNGNSYAHPLIVLVASPNQLGRPRFGVTTSRGIRLATQRNRAKRRLRHTVAEYAGQVSGGWDIILIARPSLLEATWEDVRSAVRRLLRRAGALNGQANEPQRAG